MSGPTNIGKTKFVKTLLNFLKSAQLEVQHPFFISEQNNLGENLTDESFHYWIKDEANLKCKTLDGFNRE